jgi:Acetyltransferase (GNAT) domain
MPNRTEINRRTSSLGDPRVLTTEEELVGIEPAWERLRSGPAMPTLENRQGWLQIEANTGEGMMVVTLGSDGDTNAIAPFLLKRWKLHCRLGYTSVLAFPMRVARLCGDTLLAPAQNDVQEALLEAVADASVPFDTLLIEGLRVDSPLRELIDKSTSVQRNFWTYCPAPPASHWLARLPKTFDDYNAWLGGKLRSQFRSRDRKLSAACGANLSLQRITSSQDVPAFTEAVAKLSQLSWQGRKLGQSIEVGDAQCVRIAEMAAKGWVRGYVLHSGAEPIAFVIGFQSDGVFHYSQVGYDPKWSAYSPGNVLLYRLIEDLYAHDRPDVIDFGCGDNQYKRVFGNESFNEQNVYLMRRSFYTGLAKATHSAFFNLTGFGRTALQKSGLLERVRRTLRSA